MYYCGCGRTERKTLPKEHVYARCCGFAVWKTWPEPLGGGGMGQK